MAVPRVFASSTCYDLADERDGLTTLCETFGFDIALSERGDVFYHPDLHTHACCVKEITTCHIFVLIIGGRFGGKYTIDKSKSITNAEYAAARELGVPIFTFVKQEVLNDHNLWQRNKDKSFVKQIIYPSIEKQEHALDIFTFIDQVRLAPNNNGFFGFNLIKDIHILLRKQWSAMFFEYLQNRSFSRQLASTNETLVSLSAASSKIEEMVKNIYKTIDKVSAEEAISNIILESKAKEFFKKVGTKINDQLFIATYSSDKLVKEPPTHWADFFVETDYFIIVSTDEEDNQRVLVYEITDTEVLKIEGVLSKSEQVEIRYFTSGYQAFLALPIESRRKIIEEHTYVPPPDGKTEGEESIPTTT
jgi:predicted lactoylglutathione lyase